MTAGMQIFDSGGATIYDSSYDTTRALGFGETGGKDGSLTDDRVLGMRVWVALTSCPKPSNDYKGWVAPTFSANGNIISWAYGGNNYGEHLNNKFIYGVY